MTVEYPHGTTGRILSIIPNVTVKVRFMVLKTRQHSIMMTNNRIMSARITVAQKDFSQQGREEAKRQGRGRLGQLLSNPHVYDKLLRHYLQTGPEGVLADNPANIAVDRATVSTGKLKSTAGPEGGVGSDVLVLRTTGKAYKITLGGSRAAAREALEAEALL